MSKITREELESLEGKYKLVHHSQEVNKSVITDYYDLWEFPKVRLEIEYQRFKTIGCIYSFEKTGIEIKFEGRIESLEDIKFLINRCLM